MHIINSTPIGNNGNDKTVENIHFDLNLKVEDVIFKARDVVYLHCQNEMVVCYRL